ncbi:MAG: hypothetical protein AMXMBFR56_67920 [Polyangiaceae bacterium]
MSRFSSLVRQAGLPTASPLQRVLFAIAARIETTIQAVQLTSPAPSTNDLRALAGTPGSLTALVDPVYGGLFAWSDTVAVDDGAMAINPAGAGSNAAGWRRVFEGYANVLWFGADRTGAANSSPAFNAALAYLQRHKSTVAPGPGPQGVGTGLYYSPTLFVPWGAYRFESTVVVTAYTKICSERLAMIYTNDPTISLFASYNYYNTFEGLVFVGGRHAVAFYEGLGDPSVGGPNWFQRCSWRYQYGPSLFQNTARPGTNRSMSATVMVSDFDFQGACLWWGGSDGAVFRNGHILCDQNTRPAFFDDGRTLACFVNSGIVDVEDVMGVPLPYQGASKGAWFEGTGILHSDRFRMGGEDALLPWRIRSTGMQYGGMDLPTDPSTLAVILSDRDPIASTNGTHLIEVYDDFPALISIRDPLPFGTGAARSYREFANADTTIWVDSVSCPVSKFAASAKVSCRVHFEMVTKPRFVTSPNPASATEDITQVVAQFRTDTHRDEPDQRQENLWPAGPGQLGPVEVDPSWGWFGNFNGVSASVDNSLGLDVRKWTSNAVSPTSNVYFTSGVNASTWWGAGLPPGVYTVSVLVKTNWSGSMNFTRDQSTGAMGVVQFEASERWQRLSCTFYHDGNQRLLGFSVYSMPGTSDPRGPGEIALALPAVHAGPKVLPYTRPGNATATNYVPETYYGTAAPVSGTYKVGDKIINTAPTAGGWEGWICVTAGSPGTWKTFGAISS